MLKAYSTFFVFVKKCNRNANKIYCYKIDIVMKNAYFLANIIK
jgi:hypothetical protein